MKNDSKIAGITVRGHEFVVKWDEEADEPGRPCWIEQVNLGGDWHEVTDIFSEDFCDALNVALAALPDNRFPGVCIDKAHETYKGT